MRHVHVARGTRKRRREERHRGPQLVPGEEQDGWPPKANFFRKIRLHEQVAALTSQQTEDFLVLCNRLALCDPARLFCQGRLEGFPELEKSIVT